MTNISLAYFHVATITNGQLDEHRGNYDLTRVHYDNKTFYFDLKGLNVSATDMLYFCCEAWNKDESEIDVIELDDQSFNVSIA